MEVAFGDCWVECVVVFVDFDGAVVKRERLNYSRVDGFEINVQ